MYCPDGQVKKDAAFYISVGKQIPRDEYEKCRSKIKEESGNNPEYSIFQDVFIGGLGELLRVVGQGFYRYPNRGQRVNSKRRFEVDKVKNRQYDEWDEEENVNC